MVEQPPCKRQVISSSLICGSRGLIQRKPARKCGIFKHDKQPEECLHFEGFGGLKNAATCNVAGLRCIQSELHANICKADICTTTFVGGYLRCRYLLFIFYPLTFYGLNATIYSLHLKNQVFDNLRLVLDGYILFRTSRRLPYVMVRRPLYTIARSKRAGGLHYERT